MPLFKGKVELSALPPPRKRQDEDEDDLLFPLPCGSWTRDATIFFPRIEAYQRREWTCKWTRKGKLTYAEALYSEQEAADRIHAVPVPMRDAVLMLAHLSKTPVSLLSSTLKSRFSSEFAPGERVTVRFGPRSLKRGTISTSSQASLAPPELLALAHARSRGTTKQHDVSMRSAYKVEYEDGDSMIVPFALLSRESKVYLPVIVITQMLRMFCFPTSSGPWIVKDPELRRSLGLAEPPEDMLALVPPYPVVASVDELDAIKTKAKRPRVSKVVVAPDHTLTAEQRANEGPLPKGHRLALPVNDAAVGDVLTVHQFCTTFGSLLKLSPFSAPSLARAVDASVSSPLLVEVCVQLLDIVLSDHSDALRQRSPADRKADEDRGCGSPPDFPPPNPDNWEPLLVAFLDWCEQYAPGEADRRVGQLVDGIRGQPFSKATAAVKAGLLVHLVNMTAATAWFRGIMSRSVDTLDARQQQKAERAKWERENKGAPESLMPRFAGPTAAVVDKAFARMRVTPSGLDRRGHQYFRFQGPFCGSFVFERHDDSPTWLAGIRERGKLLAAHRAAVQAAQEADEEIPAPPVLTYAQETPQWTLHDDSEDLQRLVLHWNPLGLRESALSSRVQRVQDTWLTEMEEKDDVDPNEHLAYVNANADGLFPRRFPEIAAIQKKAAEDAKRAAEEERRAAKAEEKRLRDEERAARSLRAKRQRAKAAQNKSSVGRKRRAPRVWREDEDDEDEDDEDEGSAAEVDIVCDVCTIDENDAQVMLCDGRDCTVGRHCYCENPPLRRVPRGSWFCQACAAVNAKEAEPDEGVFVDDDAVCEKCGDDEPMDSLMICDGDCGEAMHFFCLDPPLDSVPEGAWFCSSCEKKRKEEKAFDLDEEEEEEEEDEPVEEEEEEEEEEEDSSSLAASPPQRRSSTRQRRVPKRDTIQYIDSDEEEEMS